MHHNPARMMRQRRQTVVAPSATAIVDSTPTATEAVNAASLGVPTSTTALAVIVSLLAAIILLGIGYYFWRRKRNAKEEKAPSHIIDFSSEKALTYDVDRKLDLHASAYRIEKPSPAFIPVVVASAPGADMSTGWVPQIPNRSAADLASQSSMSSKKSKSSKKSLRSSRGWDKSLSKYAPSERSPPPSYMADSKTATLASQVPLPPSPPHKPTTPPTPPTPPAFKKLNPFSREIPSAKPMPTQLPPSLPLPSPARSASFATHQDAAFAQIEGTEEEMPPVRLMVVSNAFTPSLDDELPITIGETVRVLEEFQDGWSLVQRIGSIDAPKGVVPRTCLTEREKIIPSGRRL